jgi:hypothetical protein
LDTREEDWRLVEVVATVVVLVVERLVEETVALPIARVVVSVKKLSTPVISVVIPLSPSVTVVSGTPASGGVGVGDWAADCCGSVSTITANTRRHSSAFCAFIAVTRSIVLPPLSETTLFIRLRFPPSFAVDSSNLEPSDLGLLKADEYYNELLWMRLKEVIFLFTHFPIWEHTLGSATARCVSIWESAPRGRRKAGA